MTLEGNLEILLSDSRDGRAYITSTRPVHASRLFEGKTAAETLSLLPRLFSVCGHAQTVAFTRASEGAASAPANDDVEKHRQALVDLETLREHLWRVVLDWPPLLGMTAQAGLPAHLNKILRILLHALSSNANLGKSRVAADEGAEQAIALHWPTLTDGIETAVFGRIAADWQRIDTPQSLLGWCQNTDTVAAELVALVIDRDWQDLGRCEIAPLPDLPTAFLDEAFAGVDTQSFVSQPTWNGVCYETSAFTRQLEHPLIQRLRQRFGNGLLPRLAARLVEMSVLLARIPEQFEHPEEWSNHDSSPGLAQTEAARGRLVHQVKLAGETVSDYAILAPTEWNFHPAGLAAQALSSLTGHDRTNRELQARLLINAIDPCVAYELRFDCDEAPG